MNRLLPTFTLCAILVAAGGHRLAVSDAQQGAVSSAASAEDSIRHHRAARARQASFERTRRANLPWAWGGGGGTCDERIGRFCLTYSDDEDSEWVPPEEEEVVVRARDRLLDELAVGAAAIPGDRWVSGQRVRYLVEAGRFDAAIEAARACRAEAWWCDALAGFAAHQAGDAAAADAAFDRMLAGMPENTRDDWTDLSHILETPTLRVYRRLDGGEREVFERRFWTLADPLLHTGGNYLRSEHFSRNLLAELQDRAESTENISWGDDLREIILRLGAPTGWERIRPSHQLHLQDVSIVTHYPDAEKDLLPPPELLVGDFHPDDGEWDADGRRPRATYALTRGGERLRWFTPLDHQVAIFRGRDSALVVVAYELPEDSLPPEARVDAAVSARSAVEGEPLVARRSDAGREGVLALGTPHEPLLVSLELLASAENRAARARFGVQVSSLVRGVLAASDLLVLHASEDTIAESREEALRRARGSLRVSPGEKLGVYWELYSPGVPWPEALEISLRLVDADAGWLRRLAERVGVVEQIQPIRLVWGESGREEETMQRTLTLRVPEDAHAGLYTLELSVAAAGREPLISRKQIQVVR